MTAAIAQGLERDAGQPVDVEVQRYHVAPVSIVDEGDYYLVGDPATNDFYQFPPVAVDVLELLKSGASVPAIAAELRRRGDVIDIDDLIAALVALNLIKPLRGGERAIAVPGTTPYPSGSFSMAVAAGRAIFSRWGLAAYLLIVGAAGFAMSYRPDLVPTTSALAFNEHLTVTMLALLMLHGAVVMVHEGSHMLAAARHGVRSRMGFGNRLWSIVAEADLSGILALPRRQRYLPLLAGMLADTLIVALCTLALAAFTAPGGGAAIGVVLVKALILQILLTIAWQFNFYLRTDVYFLLCTYARQPRLDVDAQDYRSAVLHRISGGAIGRKATHGGRVGTAVRLFALLWLIGRLFMLGALAFIFLPTIAHYVMLAIATLGDPNAGTYRKLDMILFTTVVVTLMGVGMGMWLWNIMRAFRKGER